MEIKYVKCIISKTNGFTIGKIYNWPNPVDDNGTIRQVSTLSGSLWSFETSTEKAYEAQTKAEIISNQILDQAFCEKPVKITSPTEAISVESPLDICKKRYKKGMKVKSAKEYGEYSGEFIIDVDPSEFTNTGSGVDYFVSRGWLYINGKFADILEEPKESLTKEKGEFHLELERRTQYPITPENAFPVKALRKQLKIVNFQSIHEIKIVEEKLLKKTKSKLFNI